MNVGVAETPYRSIASSLTGAETDSGRPYVSFQAFSIFGRSYARSAV
jgi:hypothetical protein